MRRALDDLQICKKRRGIGRGAGLAGAAAVHLHRLPVQIARGGIITVRRGERAGKVIGARLDVIVVEGLAGVHDIAVAALRGELDVLPAPLRTADARGIGGEHIAEQRAFEHFRRDLRHHGMRGDTDRSAGLRRVEQALRLRHVEFDRRAFRQDLTRGFVVLRVGHFAGELVVDGLQIAGGAGNGRARQRHRARSGLVHLGVDQAAAQLGSVDPEPVRRLCQDQRIVSQLVAEVLRVRRAGGGEPGAGIIPGHIHLRSEIRLLAELAAQARKAIREKAAGVPCLESLFGGLLRVEGDAELVITHIDGLCAVFQQAVHAAVPRAALKHRLDGLRSLLHGHAADILPGNISVRVDGIAHRSHCAHADDAGGKQGDHRNRDEPEHAATSVVHLQGLRCLFHIRIPPHLIFAHTTDILYASL